MTLNLSTILRRSIVHRRARSLSALVALTVSAGVATALLTLYADLDAKLHHEFRSFGANIVVTAPASSQLPENALAQVQHAAGPDALVAPFAYAVATTDRGTPVVVAGTDFAAVRKLDSSWSVDAWPNSVDENAALQRDGDCCAQTKDKQPQVQKQIPFGNDKKGSYGQTQIPIGNEKNSGHAQKQIPFGNDNKRGDGYSGSGYSGSGYSGSALIGQRAANFVADEHAVKLTFADKPLTLRGVGRLRTGGDEDSRIYMPLAAFTAWTGTTTSVIEVQVSGSAAKIDDAIASLKSALPGMQVQPVRQLVEGESRIVDRTHTLMYAAVLLIALTVGVSVLATLSASVLERRRDFALMKALGGSQAQLISLFLLEAALLAFAGVIAGYIIGSALAWAISETNFGTASLPRLTVLPLVLLLNMAIAVMAALFPARVLRGLQPAAILKGE